MTLSARLIVALFLIATAWPAAAQQPQLVHVDVAPGLTMLTGRGGNIVLSSGEDGALLIDDQYAQSAESILKAVKAMTGGAPRFVINTHWHGDHVGGNEKMADSGAVIVAHANVRSRMSVGQFSKMLDRRMEASPDDALPVVTFRDAVTLHWNGETIDALHVPAAHTDGDTLVHFRTANAIHMGDVFFNGMYPFIDVESGGGVVGMIAACDRALELANAETRIIPGHGPLAGRQELQDYREVLEAIRRNVEALIDRGMTLEQIEDAAPTAEFDEKLGGGFISPARMTRMVHASLVEGGGLATD